MVMVFAELAGNLRRVRDEIAAVQAREGLSGEVRIVAVTKGQPAAAARAALDAGLPDIGENRVQEALAKQKELADLPVLWHLIGHLQTNKAKHVPGCFTMVHSVDSARVADALAKHNERRGLGRQLRVLVQVNVVGEEQKSGCRPEDAGSVAHSVSRHDQLRLDGLMTMAPFTDEETVQRRAFGALRRLREDLEKSGLRLPELSMGMSGDYRAAVAEGATILRLGTVLFGARPE
jgi:pyridoxal phosphate enzyme (YggS family)